MAARSVCGEVSLPCVGDVCEKNHRKEIIAGRGAQGEAASESKLGVSTSGMTAKPMTYCRWH